MERPYFPPPNTSKKEPQPNNSQPLLPHGYNHLHHHPPPFPSPYLHPPLTPSEPLRFGPAVQHPMPYFSRPLHGNINELLPVAVPERDAKIARSKRKMARQKSLNLNQLGSSSGVDLSALYPHHLCYEGIVGDRSIMAMHDTMESSEYDNKPKDPYNFIAANNKKLRILLKKELKNSDVGSLGRIVIPKRDAEENLPTLSDKEGMQVLITDINSTDRKWSVKYKFWSNNKSRMYVLENTGDFVKENGLEIGDTIILYEDKSHNFYFSIKKAEKPLQDLLQKPHSDPFSHYSSLQVTSNTTTTHEEEDAALALLIEQLRHREHHEVTLQLMDSYPSSSSSSHHMVSSITEPQTFDDNHGAHSDDRYRGVDSAHGTTQYMFPFLDQWSGGDGEDQ